MEWETRERRIGNSDEMKIGWIFGGWMPLEIMRNAKRVWWFCFWSNLSVRWFWCGYSSPGAVASVVCERQCGFSEEVEGEHFGLMKHVAVRWFYWMDLAILSVNALCCFSFCTLGSYAVYMVELEWIWGVTCLMPLEDDDEVSVTDASNWIRWFWCDCPSVHFVRKWQFYALSTNKYCWKKWFAMHYLNNTFFKVEFLKYYIYIWWKNNFLALHFYPQNLWWN